MPCKGIKVGDLGMKLGYNSMDNGWLSFDHVRVPRTNLMSRFSEVTKEGDLEVKGDLRILYSIMSQTRMAIIEDCVAQHWKALLIATRYAACRR
jgi:acyl-CoA oxidase